MKILIDTNIILDVMLDRAPFSEPASRLLSIVERGQLAGFVCATTVTTIHYLASKVMGKDLAQKPIGVSSANPGESLIAMQFANSRQNTG